MVMALRIAGVELHVNAPPPLLAALTEGWTGYASGGGPPDAVITFDPVAGFDPGHRLIGHQLGLQFAQLHFERGFSDHVIGRVDGAV